mgnify:FL=1
MNNYKKIFISSVLVYGLLLISIAIAGFVVLNNGNVQEVSSGNLKAKTEERAYFLKNSLDKKIKTANALAECECLQNFYQNMSASSTSHLKGVLPVFLKSDESIYKIIFLNKKFENVLEFEKIKDENQKHMFSIKQLEYAKNGNFLTSDIYFKKLKSGIFPAISVMIPVGKEQSFAGSFIIEFNLSETFHMFSKSTLYDVFLVDSEGKVLSIEENDMSKPKVLSSFLGNDEISLILKNSEFISERFYSSTFSFNGNNQNLKIVLINKTVESRNTIVAFVVLMFIVIAGFIPIGIYFSRLPEKLAKKSKYNLEFDLITNLPNRVKLLEDFCDKSNFSIVLINIDNFKEINNVYGFENGDELLRLVAAKIKDLIAIFVEENSLRISDFLPYKMSADEFALVVKNIKAPERDNLHEFCKFIHAKIEETKYTTKTFAIDIKVTLGSSNPIDIQDASHSLLQADLAHKIAKRTSSDLVIFDNDLSIVEQYKKNLFWISEIKQAIENDRIVPFYQPIYDVKNGKILKYETLIRLIDSNGEIKSPFDFLDLSKKVKLYHSIATLHAKKVVDMMLKTPSDISYSINIDDFSDYEFVFDLLQLVKTHDLGSRLIVEIVESDQSKDKEGLKRFIDLVHLFGCKIAIDDFGSGYSNFYHFINSGADYIKIDGSLIQNVLTDEKARRTIKAIINLAKMLNMKVVAEYVSTKEIFDHLLDYDIDYYQGFYIGKPARDILN